jgi:hypothetical protein
MMTPYPAPAFAPQSRARGLLSRLSTLAWVGNWVAGQGGLSGVYHIELFIDYVEV